MNKITFCLKPSMTSLGIIVKKRTRRNTSCSRELMTLLVIIKVSKCGEEYAEYHGHRVWLCVNHHCKSRDANSAVIIIFFFLHEWLIE